MIPHEIVLSSENKVSNPSLVSAAAVSGLVGFRGRVKEVDVSGGTIIDDRCIRHCTQMDMRKGENQTYVPSRRQNVCGEVDERILFDLKVQIDVDYVELKIK